MILDFRTLIFSFHVLFVGPLLLYIGIKGTNVPDAVFQLLIVLAIGIFLYHGSNLYLRLI